MKKRPLTVIFSLLIAGCSEQTELAAGDVVDAHSRFENIEVLDQFVSNVQNKKKDNVRFVRYTNEGDPIFYDLRFNGEKIELEIDSTEDQFGSGTIEKSICEKVERVEGNAKIEYSLNGCEGDMKSAELLRIEYNVSDQDRFDFRLNTVKTWRMKLTRPIQN
ncbi:hypothetical protein JOC77_003195 [Peribacillus deserti]|uniref:DUF4362 domain-containing protein n=1 Tax=Peribacillus deserti TaxID=673318 RepID=A0ABS2QKP9_9BACI|nr:DUF4362 domain-containing protein [Peribacillus deserti]MBM7693751.1 hypothetical protein [Peribacillus deserti]